MRRAYSAVDADAARAVYDEWAETYDAELGHDDQGYIGPDVAADALVRVVGPGATVLDAGCGTGLVGAALAARGRFDVDGVDISPGMLARAQAVGVYRRLAVADLTRRLGVDDGAYDAVVCVERSIRVISIRRC